MHELGAVPVGQVPARRRTSWSVVVAAVVGALLAWSVPAALSARAGSRADLAGKPGSVTPEVDASPDTLPGPADVSAAQDGGGDAGGEDASADTGVVGAAQTDQLGESDGSEPAAASAGSPDDLARASDPAGASDVAPPASAGSPPAASPRTSSESSGINPEDYSVHVVYAVPSDGAVRPGATSAIGFAIDALEHLVGSRTGGKTLRVDRRDGHLAVDSVRLAHSDAEVAQAPGGAADQVRSDLAATGRRSPTTLYAVFYDGMVCGSESTVSAGNRVVLLPIRPGSGESAAACGATGARPAPEPGSWAGAMARQVFDTLGIPADCLSGAAGAGSSCTGFTRSVFAEPAAANAVLPPTWSSDAGS